MTSSSPSFIYADNAATTPLCREAMDAMRPYLEERFANPSGIYGIARSNATELNRLRSSIATMLHADSPHEIYFTSGGSESDNWFLRGRIEHLRKTMPINQPIYIVVSAIEHHAILNTCKALETYNVHTIEIQPDSEGFIEPNELRATLEEYRDGTVALVSVMLANNEIGTIEDIRSLVSIAHEYGVPFHTDAVQAVGHIDVDIDELEVDALSLSAHKFHGPHGEGVLYIRSGVEVAPLITGGGQELHLRAGTENLAGIAGMEAALRKMTAPSEQQKRNSLARLRSRLVDHILEETEDVVLTGPNRSEFRLPGNASFCCKNVDGELLMVLLDKAEIAASTGSACNTGSTEPSHVVTAIGITDPQWNKGTLRLSLSEDATEEVVDELARRTIQAIGSARKLSGMEF